MTALRHVARLIPSVWKPSFDAACTLLFDYAHLASVRQRSCVDASNNPVPWYTYPAIDYLRQLDFSNCTVFEYGSGNSTLFWSSVARRVMSVEDDAKWYQVNMSRLPANCELILERDLEHYPNVIDRYPEPFDVIIVDGAARGRTRLKCAKRAIARLREGGMIILDNSDWLPESARVLRESGLIEVDMTGLAPISGHTQTTSFSCIAPLPSSPGAPVSQYPGRAPCTRCGNGRVRPSRRSSSAARRYLGRFTGIRSSNSTRQRAGAPSDCLHAARRASGRPVLP